MPKGDKVMNGFCVNIEILAHQMISKHGPRASIVAGSEAIGCIDRDGKNGRDYWMQVYYEIRILQREKGLPSNWGSGCRR